MISIRVDVFVVPRCRRGGEVGGRECVVDVVGLPGIVASAVSDRLRVRGSAVLSALVLVWELVLVWGVELGRVALVLVVGSWVLLVVGVAGGVGCCSWHGAT